MVGKHNLESDPSTLKSIVETCPCFLFTFSKLERCPKRTELLLPFLLCSCVAQLKIFVRRQLSIKTFGFNHFFVFRPSSLRCLLSCKGFLPCGAYFSPVPNIRAHLCELLPETSNHYDFGRSEFQRCTIEFQF